MIRVLIADDHAVVRQGLRSILATESDLEVAGESDSAASTLDAVRRGGWDAVILDISMPGARGLDLLQEIRQESPRLPVLILSMHAEEQFALRSLRAGAAGYLTKMSAPAELVAAVRKVTSGGRYVTASVAERIAAALAGGDGPPHERLSDREFQVMRLIAAGRRLREIADDLSLSEKTVGTYRVRVFEKLGITRHAELVRYAVEHGLVE